MDRNQPTDSPNSMSSNLVSNGAIRNLSNASIPELLEIAGSTSIDRNNAETILLRHRDTDFNNFVLSLLQYLVDSSKPVEIRQLSGILFKNSITSMNGSFFREKCQQWVSLDNNLRTTVKQYLLNTLMDPSDSICRAAANAISAVALIELPMHSWNDLFDILYSNIMNSQNEKAIMSSLITIQYICNDFFVNPNVDIASIDKNSILTIFKSLFFTLQETMNPSIQSHAMQAMTDAICLASDCFKVSEERDPIMAAIIQYLKSPIPDACIYAFKCASRVIEYYYDHLDPYIQQIYNATVEGLNNNNEQIAIEAALVIQSLIEVEMAVSESSPLIYKRYIDTVLKDISLHLANALIRQHDLQDLDMQSVSDCASDCILLLCKFKGDEMPSLLSPFMFEHFSSPNWRLKQASIVLFGSLMVGPSPESIQSIINQGCNMLLSNIENDTNPYIKETSVWALGNALTNHSSFFNVTDLDHIMLVFISTLDSVPRIANSVCRALYNVADVLLENEGEKQQTNLLSKYAFSLIQALLKTAEREDWCDANLQTNCYEAIIKMIDAGAEDTADLLSELTSFLIEKLKNLLNMTNGDMEFCYALQTHILDALTSLLRKATVSQEHCDACMTIIDHLYNGPNQSAHSSAMMMLSPLIHKLDGCFENYQMRCFKYIHNGLFHYEDRHNCSMSCLAIGEFCICCNHQQLKPYADQFVADIQADLNSNDCLITIKPLLFNALTDLSLSLEEQFLSYFDMLMPITLQVAILSRDVAGDECDDYLTSLRESVLELWLTILMTLDSERQLDRFNSYFNTMFELIQLSVSDEMSSDDLIMNALIFVHDLCKSYGKQFAITVTQLPWFNAFVTRCSTIMDRGEEVQKLFNDIHVYSQN